MLKFTPDTDAQAKDIRLNPCEVSHVYSLASGKHVIVMSNGNSLYVTESLDEICTAIADALNPPSPLAPPAEE